VKIGFGETGMGAETGLGEKNELAEVAEGGGAAVGDAVGRKGFEDAFEGAVDVEAAVLLREELGEFGGKVCFEGWVGFVEVGVRGTIVADGGGQGALAAVGEGELAKIWEGSVLAFGGHFCIVYHNGNIIATIIEFRVGSFEFAVSEKRKKKITQRRGGTLRSAEETSRLSPSAYPHTPRGAPTYGVCRAYGAGGAVRTGWFRAEASLQLAASEERGRS
jgi:hypothetical protein